MQPQGIKLFQEEKNTITKELIQKAADNLFKTHVNITGKSIFFEYQKLFKKRKLDYKYFVSEQTISRNKQYSLIWKNIQKSQKKEKKANKPNKKDQNIFSLRDQYDLLQQDYIELLDRYTLLEKERKEQDQEINKIRDLISIKELHKSDNFALKKHPLNIIKSIKSLLENGMVTIIKKDNKIIFKNNTLREDNRIEIKEEEWNNI